MLKEKRDGDRSQKIEGVLLMSILLVPEHEKPNPVSDAVRGSFDAVV